MLAPTTAGMIHLALSTDYIAFEYHHYNFSKKPHKPPYSTPTITVITSRDDKKTPIDQSHHWRLLDLIL